MSNLPNHNWRPDVADTVLRPFDRLGRGQPRRIGMFTLMRAIPDLREQFGEVPSEYWGEDLTADGYTCAAVSCPCGQTPRVEIGLIDSCAGCSRVFYFTGSGVFVANSPKGKSDPSPDGSSPQAPPGASDDSTA